MSRKPEAQARSEGRRRAVFLDRDGVIVVPEFRDGRSFAPRRLEEFRFYPDALESLERLNEAGYLLVVVTNQPEVGSGLIPVNVVQTMNRRMQESFPIHLIKVCTHTRADDCNCRKPRPGMLLEAARELSISLPDSYIVGDRASDIEAGEAVACRTVFVDLDYDEPKPKCPDHVVASLGEAASIIINNTAS